jgi:hypothetical protein
VKESLQRRRDVLLSGPFKKFQKRNFVRSALRVFSLKAPEPSLEGQTSGTQAVEHRKIAWQAASFASDGEPLSGFLKRTGWRFAGGNSKD